MLKTKLLEQSLVAATGVGVTFLLTRLFAAPAPLAYFDCTPEQGKAPLTVTCTASDQQAKTFRWDFGDGGLPKTDRIVEHEFVEPREHTVRLEAHVGQQSDEFSRIITVSAADDWPPFEITLVGVLQPGSVVRTQAFAIDLHKSDHPNLGHSDTRTFERSFTAIDGFRFLDAEFELEEETHASTPVWQIVDEGRTMTFSVELTSGPKWDRWDGWLKGQLETRQERVVAAEPVLLAEELTISSEAPLPIDSELSVDTLDRVIVKSGTGRVLGSAEPGELLRLESRGVGLRLARRAEGLVLLVEKLG